MAEVIDKQVATIIHCLDLHPDWKQKMAELAVVSYNGPNPEELREKRRRIVRAYGDGGYTDQEYKIRLAEIDRQIEQTSVVTPPAVEDAAKLFEDIPMLWNEATTEERRTLVRSLVDLVYVDLETKQVTAIKPTQAFRELFGVGIDVGPDTPVKLVPPGEAANDIGGDGGDGGELNSPSRRDRSEYPTSLVGSFSRLVDLCRPSSARSAGFCLHCPYRRQDGGTPTLFRPLPSRRGRGGVDVSLS